MSDRAQVGQAVSPTKRALLRWVTRGALAVVASAGLASAFGAGEADAKRRHSLSNSHSKNRGKSRGERNRRKNSEKRRGS